MQAKKRIAGNTPHSELSEALALSAALPSIYKQERERLERALNRHQVVSTISMLADALESMRPIDGWEGLIRALGVQVRVAVEHFPQGRLEHKHYAEGNSRGVNLSIGNDETLHAWIIRKDGAR
jgi:hypothetical protein